jgi:hypothetical protein
MVNNRKIAMKDIGYADVESYVRTLVSEGFEKQLKDAVGSTEQSGGPDAKTPPLVPDQPNNRKKDHRNGTDS